MVNSTRRLLLAVGVALVGLCAGCVAAGPLLPTAVPTDADSPLAVSLVAEPATLKVGEPVSMTVAIKNTGPIELVIEQRIIHHSITGQPLSYPYWVLVTDPAGEQTVLDAWSESLDPLWLTQWPIAAGEVITTTSHLSTVYPFQDPGRYRVQVRYVSKASEQTDSSLWVGEAYSSPLWIEVTAP